MRNVSNKIAHTAILPLGNKDLRLLQDLITAEKSVVSRYVGRCDLSKLTDGEFTPRSLQKLADDLAKASEALKSFVHYCSNPW